MVQAAEGVFQPTNRRFCCLNDENAELLRKRSQKVIAKKVIAKKAIAKKASFMKSLSDPRAARTRLFLQQALGEMLTEQSFASVTVAAITRRAGVNRATFYAHFQDKDDLLEWTLREKCRRVLQNALPPSQTPATDAWRHLIGCVLDFFAAMPSRCPQAARQWNGIVANAMREELDCLLENWLADALPISASRQTLIAAISGAVVTSGMHWLRGKADMTTQAGAAELAHFIVQGLQ